MHIKHALWIALALSASASAQIYRCDGPSGPVFSQTPCAPTADRIVIKEAIKPAESRGAYDASIAPGLELLEQDRLDRAAARGQVMAGMTPAQVRRALGEPLRINNSYGSGGRRDQWVYVLGNGSRYVHFVNGRVTD